MNSNRQSGSVQGVLLAVLTAAFLVESVVVVMLYRQVSELTRTREATAAEGAPAPIALGEEIQLLRDRVDLVSKGQAEQAKEISERIDALEGTVTERSAMAGKDGPASIGSTEVESLVAKAVEKKLEEELPNRDGGEWKPSLDQFKDTLKLNEYQAQQSEKILDDGKAELFKLAGLKRNDGTSLLDDLVAAVSDPVDQEGAMKDWFMSLFKEKIPGREETYIAEIIRVKGRTEKALVDVLDETQAKKMKRLNIDYLGVKTSYDPFAEYVQEALR